MKRSELACLLREANQTTERYRLRECKAIASEQTGANAPDAGDVARVQTKLEAAVLIFGPGKPFEFTPGDAPKE